MKAGTDKEVTIEIANKGNVDDAIKKIQFSFELSTNGLPSGIWIANRNSDFRQDKRRNKIAFTV